MMKSPFGRRVATMMAWATLCALTVGGKLLAGDFPQAEISNGQLRVKLYLPDADKGYYRSSRFDWSGVIASLEYRGHNYYGPWFDRMDPKVHDYAYVGRELVVGSCAGTSGPVEEFQTNGSALGWDEAKVGGTFIKIGVGILRKAAGAYDSVTPYEIVKPGSWTVRKHPDSVEFTQELTDAASGYGYIYKKTVRLGEGKPEMVLEHSLKNIGRRTIQTDVYNHNFLVLDKQPPGPDFSISVPFQIHSPNPPNKDLVQIRGNQIVFSKVLENKDLVETLLQGFGATPKDYDIRIENRKVGAGMRIRGDRPLSSENFWTIRTVLAIEPFISMTIAPGSEFAWNTYYEYYTLPATPRR